MRQLFLDDKLATLQAGKNITVTEENPYFTKSGAYTLDIVCTLEDSANLLIFGIINRHDVRSYERKFAARLVFNNRTLFGEAHITKIDETSVSIQILSGNALLNNNVGDLFIDELDLGVSLPIHAFGVYGEQETLYFPILNSKIDSVVNAYDYRYKTSSLTPVFNDLYDRLAPQPYLCVVIKKIIEAVGYDLGVNEIENTFLKNLFIANSSITRLIADTLPHWTVNEFFTELEKFAGVMVVASDQGKVIDILFRSSFYNSNTLTIRDVVDEFDNELSGDANDSGLGNVSYDIGSEENEMYERFSDSVLKNSTIEDSNSLSAALLRFSELGQQAFSYILNVKGIHYIQLENEQGGYARAQYNSFRDLIRNNVKTDADLVLKMKPVMFCLFNYPVYDAQRFPATKTGDSVPALTMISEGSDIEYSALRRKPSTKPMASAFRIYEQFDIEDPDEKGLDEMRLGFWDGVVFQNLPLKFKDRVDNVDYLKYGVYPFPFSVPKHYYYLLGTPCNSETMGRTWSLELNLVEGRETLGEIAHLSQITINESIPYVKRFISNDLLSVRKKFIINNKRFVCKKITIEINDDGIVPYQEGEFYMMND